MTAEVVYACQVVGLRDPAIGVVRMVDAVAVRELLQHRHPDRWVEARDVASGEVVVRLEPVAAIVDDRQEALPL